MYIRKEGSYGVHCYHKILRSTNISIIRHLRDSVKSDGVFGNLMRGWGKYLESLWENFRGPLDKKWSVMV